MASCNGEVMTCKDKKKLRKRKKCVPLDKVDGLDNCPTNDSCLMRNTSLEKDTVRDPAISNKDESDITESQSNLESTCSQTSKRKRKRIKKNKKKNEENAKENQNMQIDIQGDTSSIKGDSVGTNLCQESAVNTDEKADSKIAPHSQLTKTQRKKMRKKQKLLASRIDDKAHVPLAELNSVKMEENALISERQSNSLGSQSASSINKHDNNGEGGLLLAEKENIQTRQMKGTLRIYRKRKSSDSEENIVPVTLARQASSDLNNIHSFEVSENEAERVQARECASSIKVAEKFLTENTSSNCSVGEFASVESNKITEVKDVDLDVHIKDNLPQVSYSSVTELHVDRPDKKLLILDVNGLLVDILPYGHISNKADITISHKSVFKRPFCDDFLQFCFKKFNVGVWSSRTKKNMDKVIDFLMGDSRHKLLFCWHQSHCTNTGFTTVENNSKPLVLKELKKLWDKFDPRLPWNKGEYDESNTLLLDDSPYKALRNPPHTAIFPHTYCYKDAGDSSLGPGGDLRVYLERLAEAQNVQDFVAQHPFGQRAITKSNPSWGFYKKLLGVASRQRQVVASGSGNTI
ncbi:uncharacterized protein LOC8284414 [Ricinus communis]|uniref:uncharacterized protein LOC8284414 n=1 Tax=Ricinus communis TaxID=3988 RepID=UPI00201A805E|nr:uncharacterized protein LOC8284414 [Ricinus communis]